MWQRDAAYAHDENTTRNYSNHERLHDATAKRASVVQIRASFFHHLLPIGAPRSCFPENKSTRSNQALKRGTFDHRNL